MYANWDNNGQIPYPYLGEQNNMFVFFYKTEQHDRQFDYVAISSLSFSKDYKRMNYRSSHISVGEKDIKLNRVYIYEQAEPPKKEEPKPVTPDRMW